MSETGQAQKQGNDHFDKEAVQAHERLLRFHEKSIAHYASLLELLEQRNDFFNKALIALSAAGFSITLAALNTVISWEGVVLMAAFPLAWICWGVSCGALLSCYKIEASFVAKQIAEIDHGLITFRKEMKIKPLTREKAEEIIDRFPQPKPLYVAIRTSRVGIAFFIAAYLSVFSFASANALRIWKGGAPVLDSDRTVDTIQTQVTGVTGLLIEPPSPIEALGSPSEAAKSGLLPEPTESEKVTEPSRQ